MARANTKPTSTPTKEAGQSTATDKLPPAPARSGPTEEQIARRAYEIFLARGGTHGSHEQDWFQAERELRLGRQ